MNAYGQHVIVKLPPQKKKTDGGIELPSNAKQKFQYGRAVSVGSDIRNIGPGAIIVYDSIGARALALDPVKDEGVVVIHSSMVFSVEDDKFLVDRNLPIPE